jgi:holo-[acyl-carrier protein] synthase
MQDGDGAPYIEIGGEVARRAASSGIRKWHLSISHEKGHAVAVVALEA